MKQSLSVKILCLLSLCLWGINECQAQIKRANSPYSYFGIGDIEPTAFGMNRGIGGLSVGLRSAVNINIDNPASLSAIKRTIFEAGFDMNLYGLNAGTQSQRMSDSGIAYLALAVPVTKFWGSSVGLLPFSSVYYGIDEEIEVENIGTQTYQYVGTGSLYQFYWANGFTYKAVSAGVHIGHIFGNLNRNILSYFPDVDDAMGYNFDERSNYSGFIWNTAVQYHPKLTDRITMTIGMNLGTASELNKDVYTELNRLPVILETAVGDSTALINTENLNQAVTLPNKFGFGATVNKGANWLAGFDIEIANWSETNMSDVNARYVNTVKLKVGAAFVPYQEGLRNFFNQTQYRVGMYANNNYFEVRETEGTMYQSIGQFGVTLGAGFPLSKRQASRLNLSFDMGQRGNDLLRENYFKMHIGVTLNDLWFVKPKFD